VAEGNEAAARLAAAICQIFKTSERPSQLAASFISRANLNVAYWQILLQKSKVASVRIFGETLKREAIDDSYNLNRATEVAYEFSVRR
jgi:hypothetical protein